MRKNKACAKYRRELEADDKARASLNASRLEGRKGSGGWLAVASYTTAMKVASCIALAHIVHT